MNNLFRKKDNAEWTSRSIYIHKPHQRLLLKLKAHGIGNCMINWIEKWLIDRRQRVVVDGEVSNWKSVLS